MASNKNVPGAFLAQADTSLLLVTQDKIASALDSASSAPLLLVAYNLGFCISLPVVSMASNSTCLMGLLAYNLGSQYGGLSDIYGCKTFLLLSYALFGIGCLIR